MGYISNFIVYTLAMVGVIVIALMVFKGATGTGSKKGSRYLKIHDTLTISPRKTLYIVSAGKEKFLIAGDVDRTTLISKLNVQNPETINNNPILSNQESFKETMENLPEKIRIKDIARMAGVSAGSVDRIIHNRGNVSKKSKEKILAVMKEINYKPNAIASALASKKEYKIACFLPDTKESEYWSLVVEGIKHAENELSDFNFKATYIHFNQFDENSFIEDSKKLFEEGISGVLMVPAFKEESKKIILQLQEKEILLILGIKLPSLSMIAASL